MTAPCATETGGSCCQTADSYKYRPIHFAVGKVEGGAGPVPQIATALTLRDRLGAVRVRWGVRRSHYRVPPGLYAVGTPSSESPMLVTANFKLTVDALRKELDGLDAWILVLDTKGVNVWCAAGKGTFSTDELVHQVEEARLTQVLSHRRLIVPQLGATGVAKHLVRERCGFNVVFGPVRATDLPAFLAQGLKADADMRIVRFPFWARVKLIPVELAAMWNWKTILSVLVVAFLAGLGGDSAFDAAAWGVRVGFVFGLLLVPVVAGAVLVPAALPLIPGRAFATKGALVGAVLAAGTVTGLSHALPPLALAGLATGITALASYLAMNFTGSSTFTSPTGVEKEMRRHLPWQVLFATAATLLFVAQMVLRLVGVEL